MNKKIKTILYIVLTAGLVLLVKELDFEEVSCYLGLVNKPYLVLSMTLQFVTMVLLGVQWSSMIDMAGFKGSVLQAFLMNARGNVGDAATPGVKVGGELLRYSEMRERFSLRAEESVLVVALQKLISISAFYTLVISSLFYLIIINKGKNIDVIPLLFLGFGFGVALILLILIFVRPKVLYDLLEKLRIREDRKDKLYSFIEKYNTSLERFKGNKSEIILQFLLALMIWGLYAIKFAIVLKAFSVEVDIFTCGLIIYISYMAGMIPLLPGGLGTFEGTMVGLLSLLSLGTSGAMSIIIVFRIVTFWFELFLSLLFVLVEKPVEKLTKRERLDGVGRGKKRRDKIFYNS